jgi:glycosyltransferase involved in cell wall biosynthesis
MDLFGLKKRFNIKLRLQERRINEQLDIIRSSLDCPPDLLNEFLTQRSGYYQRAFEEEEPLVTVCIATYNRAQLVTERAISSVLNQSYKNIELIVVGDHCTDETPKLIKKIDDPRLVFVNLEERGQYPSHADLRWMVAGTKPMNHGLALAQGRFITHLDDDDRYAPDRIEKLLNFVQSNKLDLAWHPFESEGQDGQWSRAEALDFVHGQVTSSSVFYHHWFKRIPWDMNAYKLKEPGDWNRYRKFKYLEAAMKRYPESLLFHYKERNQKS